MKNANTTSQSNLYLFAKNSGRVYNVAEKEDGSLFITLDGVNSIPNVGLFIQNIGGIDAVKARCVRDVRSFEEIKRDRSAQRKAAMERKKKRTMQRNIEAEAYTERAIEELIARTSGGIIEATIDNLRVVARYLSAHNWGLWKLPKMAVEYKANQYEDGSVTIIFDRPIDVLGIKSSKFVFGARPNELTEYTHMRF